MKHFIQQLEGVVTSENGDNAFSYGTFCDMTLFYTQPLVNYMIVGRPPTSSLKMI